MNSDSVKGGTRDKNKEVDKDRPKPSALPPLNALRNFEAVARHGSFAAAAADLHVTHWAVGKQIRLLEDWFGVPLFERRARGVLLTDEGAALLNDVSTAFERLASAGGRLRQDPLVRRVSGVVRLNVLPSFALGWLLPRLSAFQSRFPEIDVRISTTSRKLRYIADAFDLDPEHRREIFFVAEQNIHFPDQFAIDLLRTGLSADRLPQRFAIVQIVGDNRAVGMCAVHRIARHFDSRIRQCSEDSAGMKPP